MTWSVWKVTMPAGREHERDTELMNKKIEEDEREKKNEKKRKKYGEGGEGGGGGLGEEEVEDVKMKAKKKTK